MVTVSPRKDAGKCNKGVFPVASSSRRWGYCRLAPSSPLQACPHHRSGQLRMAIRLISKGGLCTRKFTELKLLVLRKSKVSPSPKKSAAISSFHLTLEIQVCTKDPLTKLPNTYLRPQLQRKYSGCVEGDEGQEMSGLRREEMLVWTR